MTSADRFTRWSSYTDEYVSGLKTEIDPFRPFKLRRTKTEMIILSPDIQFTVEYSPLFAFWKTRQEKCSTVRRVEGADVFTAQCCWIRPCKSSLGNMAAKRLGWGWKSGSWRNPIRFFFLVLKKPCIGLLLLHANWAWQFPWDTNANRGGKLISLKILVWAVVVIIFLNKLSPIFASVTRDTPRTPFGWDNIAVSIWKKHLLKI